MIAKTVCLSAATALLMLSAEGQDKQTDIIMHGNARIPDVVVEEVLNDTLVFLHNGARRRIPIAPITSIERIEPSHLSPGALIAAVALGAGGGYMLGNALDKSSSSISPYGSQSEGTSVYPILLTALGGIGGGIIATAVGLHRNSDVYDLTDMDLRSKAAMIRAAVSTNARSAVAALNRGNTVYLKDGTAVSGQIIEIIPDRSITVKQPNDSIAVYRMADVARVSREDTLLDAIAPPGAPPGSSAASTPVDQQVPRRSFFRLLAGAAIPVGEFGSDGASGGAAATGISVAAEGVFPIDPHADFIAGLTYCSNGVDVDKLGLGGTGVTATADSWNTLWPMVGIRLRASLSEAVEAQVAGRLGMLIGWSPAIRLSNGVNYVDFSSASGKALAYGAGGGVLINGKFSIDLHYYFGEPSYSIGISGTGLNLSAKGKQSTGILSVTGGIVF